MAHCLHGPPPPHGLISLIHKNEGSENEGGQAKRTANRVKMSSRCHWPSMYSVAPPPPKASPRVFAKKAEEEEEGRMGEEEEEGEEEEREAEEEEEEEE